MARATLEPDQLTDPDSAEPENDTSSDVDATGAAASEVETTDTDTADTAGAPDTSRSGRVARLARGAASRWPAIVMAVCVAGSLAFVGHELWERHQMDSYDSMRAEYLQTAKDGVVSLTTVNSKTADADIKRLLSKSSGTFKTDFSSRSGSYTQIVKEAQVSSKGTILSAGIEKIDSSSATILVAAHAEVTNENATDPEGRDYRFRVVVTNGEPMTISKVDFVL
ncbi:hypothetical protein ACWDTD_18745 [Gordonia sp. NPDC003425]